MNEEEPQAAMHRNRRGLMLRVLAAIALPAVLCLGLSAPPAVAQRPALIGSAFGFFTSVGLFGGPATDIGPVPLVTLPPEGSAEPVTATDPNGETAQFGPAVIVEPTSMTVSTQGEGEVITSSAVVTFAQNQDEQVDPFNAGDVTSECTTTSSGPEGSVVLTAGSLVLSTDESSGEALETIEIPTDPEPNTTYGGTIDHLGDTFRAVFNEQIVEGDILTVNAVHLFFGQDAQGNETDGVARGEAVIGQAVCGTGNPTDDVGSSNDRTTDTPAETSATTNLESEGELAADGDEGGGGGTALLIGALALGGVVVAALALRSRQPDIPPEE